MSRSDENKKFIEHFMKVAREFPEGTFEEMVAWHLGAMNRILIDISESLAIIADNTKNRK